MQLNETHDFPVSIQPAFTQKGIEIPRIRAVVRDDTGVPLASVSPRYQLIKHNTVLEAAESFVRKLGIPQREISLGSNGAYMVGTFEFMDKKIALKKGDLVGMRVYIQNSYNAKTAVIIKVGGVVMSCMNGMVSHKDVFYSRTRHSLGQEVVFPNPELVLDSFHNSCGRWSQLQEMDLNPVDAEELELKAIELGVMPKGVNKTSTQIRNAWDLHQKFTYHITHVSKASGVGKLRMLNHVSKWFDDIFHKPADMAVTT